MSAPNDNVTSLPSENDINVYNEAIGNFEEWGPLYPFAKYDSESQKKRQP